MFKSRQNPSTREITESIFIMAHIAELKEWDNRAHLKRIKAYAYTLCTGLDIPHVEAEIIALACQLHDIGKSTTPEEMLLRNGEYTDLEWRLMEKHTLEGEALLRGAAAPVLQMGAQIALTHHERWNGSGYPNRLVGDAVPLSGRVCAVADVFDALTTERPYKESIGDQQALALIQRSSGILFDQEVVRVFTSKFKEILNIKNSPSD